MKKIIQKSNYNELTNKLAMVATHGWNKSELFSSFLICFSVRVCAFKVTEISILHLNLR